MPCRLYLCQGHPFDLTKTRLQTAPPGAYKGAVDVVKKTLARDGVLGYGILPDLAPSLSDLLLECIEACFRRFWA